MEISGYRRFYVWTRSISNVASLFVYAVVIYQLKRLSENPLVNRCQQRTQQIRVAKMFAWIALSDLLLDVIPYGAIALVSAYGGSIFALRISACLILLNRSVNIFVYMWKFKAVRVAARENLRCRFSHNYAPVRPRVRFARHPQLINIE